MEKIIMIEEGSIGLKTVNKELEKGWKVKMITPFVQTISTVDGNSYFRKETGNYGAYVVLEKN